MLEQKIILFAVLLINFNHLKAFRHFDVNGLETLLAMKSENITVQCKSDMPMAYCGFIHPSGKRYSFSGTTLDDGKCSKKIQVSANDSGIWRCHIGGKDSIGEEMIQNINVRVVEQLAAVQKNITTVHGKEVTLACATTRGMLPLSYCRFEPPKGKPFSINSNVNVNNSIQGRYYFPKNLSLDRGDCAVTIRKIKYEDVGIWTCGAGLDNGEHIDSVFVEVEGFYTMSTASATGIIFGAVGVAMFLGILGFIVWKKPRLLGHLQPAEASYEMDIVQLPSPVEGAQGSSAPVSS